jgi:3-deoxy-D-manno-octulosonate cytidylyltransferase
VPERDRIIGVIPARYQSTRFPGKPLAVIAGRPMIVRVLEAVSRARLVSRVVVATDDPRIARVVEEAGGEALMTAVWHRSGTDRVAEAAGRIEAPYYINIQGDEPLMDPDAVDAVAGALIAGAEMATCAARISTRNELFDQNVVKVVLDADGHAMYFSRHAIPFPRKYLDLGSDVDLRASAYLRHLGTYGYSRRALAAIAEAAPCEMEELESLEQLRALFLGIRIKVLVVDSAGPCVDVPGDIAAVEKLLSTRGGR